MSTCQTWRPSSQVNSGDRPPTIGPGNVAVEIETQVGIDFQACKLAAHEHSKAEGAGWCA